MNNRYQFFMLLIAVAFVIGVGCSGGNSSPVIPDTENVPDLTPAPDHPAQSANTYLLGYYDIYFDFAGNTFEAVEDRTAAFTLNIVPLLNKMTLPMNGITFGSIIIHDSNPTFLGVDVEFSIHHPFPGKQQYDAYDLIGVVIGDGAHMMEYNGLRTAEYGTDLWMNNPDGYTRWFNPTEFTTELIFGWAPGGWQSLKGKATLNPYKYYSMHLGKDDDLWNYLTSDNNWDGFFESGSGRTMELEFPLPPNGLGLKFGYAIVVEWEEQGPTGPYYPVHRTEALAVSVSQTPDVWYNSNDGTSGGKLILDIDLFAWEFQPSTIILESTVLDGNVPFDFQTYAAPGGEHYSTWHVETPATLLTSSDDHDVWVIAEYEGFDYKNELPGNPSADGALAAFMRFKIQIQDSTLLADPVAVAEIVGSGQIAVGDTAEFDASSSYDQDEGGDSIVSYSWDFDSNGIYGDPYDSGTDSNPFVQYNTAGTYYIDVEVTDDEGATDKLDIPLELTVEETLMDPVAVAEIVTPEPWCPNDPIEFDGSDSYDQDEGGDSIVSWEWDFDGDGVYGDPYDSGTDQNPMKIFIDFGTYEIDLMVTDNEGATDTLDTPLSLAVGGETTWVDDDAVAPYDGSFENPWPTIQDGIDNASGDCGDKWVLVKDGTYEENINFISNITVEGYSTPAPLIQGPDVSSSTVVNMSVSNSTIKHFQLKPRTSGYGINVGGSGNTVDDIEFLDNAGGLTCEYGVRASGTGHTVNSVRVDGYHKSAAGFIYMNGQNSTLTNCVVLNMTFTAAGWMNVYRIYQGGSNSLFAKNVVGHVTFSQPFVSTQWASVVNFEYCEGSTFRNNLIFDIDNNLGETGWTWGIDANRIQGATFEHCTVTEISGPAWIYSFEITHNNADPSTTTHRDHIVAYIQAGSWKRAYCGSWGSSFPVDYSSYYSVTTPFYHDMIAGTGFLSNANPMFLDPSNDDYRVGSGSPCEGTAHDGTDMGAYGGSDPLTWLPD